jgi:hypothetical protein
MAAAIRRSKIENVFGSISKSKIENRKSKNPKSPAKEQNRNDALWPAERKLVAERFAVEGNGIGETAGRPGRA